MMAKTIGDNYRPKRLIEAQRLGSSARRGSTDGVSIHRRSVAVGGRGSSLKPVASEVERTKWARARVKWGC